MDVAVPRGNRIPELPVEGTRSCSPFELYQAAIRLMLQSVAPGVPVNFPDDCSVSEEVCLCLASIFAAEG